MVLGLLLSGDAYANINTNKRLNNFYKWLYDNGHYELVEKVESEKCKSFDIGDTNWYYNNCDQPGYKSNLDIKTYRGWIPEEVEKPNYETLLYEFFKFNIFPFVREKRRSPEKYEVKPSSKPHKFKSNIQEDKYIDKQFQKTGLISYLRFEDGQITIDKTSPNDRFGKFISNKTILRSMSVGKSMVSYVAGHAICEGYIDSVNSILNDWPLIENTLYYDQKLIDLLNMKAGDRNYVQSSDLRIKDTGFDGINHHHDIEEYMSVFKNTKKIKSTPFNYSQMATELILNYVLFKTGDDFEKILKALSNVT